MRGFAPNIVSPREQGETSPGESAIHTSIAGYLGGIYKTLRLWHWGGAPRRLPEPWLKYPTQTWTNWASHASWPGEHGMPPAHEAVAKQEVSRLQGRLQLKWSKRKGRSQLVVHLDTPSIKYHHVVEFATHKIPRVGNAHFAHAIRASVCIGLV